MLVEDKIKHCLIRVNQLREMKEDKKYIIPQLHIATKLMCELYKEQHFNQKLMQKIVKQFNQVLPQDDLRMEQVHQFMVEEIREIIESRNNKLSAVRRYRRHSIFPPNQSNNLVQQVSLIIIPQETYYFSTPGNSEIDSQSHIDNIPNRKAIFLEAVPSFLNRQQERKQIWQRVQKLYSEHKLDQAYQECSQFKKKLFLADPNFNLCEDMQELNRMIEKEYEEMTQKYQYFDQPGYTLDKQDKGVTLYYKIYEESKEVAVRVEAELDISLENFMCIVSEIDLFQEYIPFSYDTKHLKTISRNKKLGVSKAYMPLLSDRMAYFYAAAYDRLSTHNSIFFYSKTISKDLQFLKKVGLTIQKDESMVDLQYKFYIMEYTPVSLIRGKIRLAINVNMQLGFLPMFVLNKSCRTFAFDYFKNMMKVNKDFKGSEWEKKMKANSDTYIHFKERVKEHIQENQ